MSLRGSIDDERGGLLSELTTGFEALMHRADELVAANAHLTERLTALQVELRNQYTPNQTSSASSAACTGDGLAPSPINWRQDAAIDKGIQAWKLLKIATVSAVPLRNNKIFPGQEVQSGGVTTPLAAGSSPLEKDFTTQGSKGDLKCPFSKRGATKCGNTPTTLEVTPSIEQVGSERRRPVSPDPIPHRALANTDNLPAEPTASTVPVCPIRLIDQQSPEELVKYVENHKHEIPRSHEVCVKRYQANEESIRALDAKYGSLVKMIQELGKKHKAMLPAEVEADAQGNVPMSEQRSMEKVEKWAQDLPDGEEPPPLVAVQSDKGSEIRTGHFERPLEEVRLGESPSRPWGIRVPYGTGDVPGLNAPIPGKRSRPSSVAPPANAPVHENDLPKAKGKCPFNHEIPHLRPPAAERDNASRSNDPYPMEKHPFSDAFGEGGEGKGPPRIVFTGPVFFGYSAEDAAVLVSMVSGRNNASQD